MGFFGNRARKRLATVLEKALDAQGEAEDLLAEARRNQSYLWASQLRPMRKTLEEAGRQVSKASRSWWIPRVARKLTDDLVKALEKLAGNLLEHNSKYEAREVQVLDAWLAQTGRTFTHSQKLAVVRDDKANLVVASAGSGKTAVLVHRVAHLVRKGVPPQRILAVTFTRPAAQEMETRLKDDFGIEGAVVRTFHSLGNEILRMARNPPPGIFKESDFQHFIRDALNREVQTQGPFLQDLLMYASFPDAREARRDEFPSDRAFYEHMRNQEYVTLRGERVQSLAEKQIADFLTIHGVNYRYEGIADWAPRDSQKGLYRPDFTLTDYGFCIEHWTIRDHQQVPKWYTWTTTQYRAKMDWARNQFKMQGRTLIETYSDEFWDSSLDQVLRERLQAAGVRLQRLTYKQLLTEVRRHHQDLRLLDLFERWISNAKARGLTAEDIPQHLKGQHVRTQAFGRCGQRLLEAYERHLQASNLVDFSDMIHEATRYMQAHPETYLKQFDHVLVDEFQDMSQDRIEFLQCLSRGSARLFCVGDDWQAIYSFAGSDVRFILNFESCFGPATITRLEESHRCPRGILEAGNRLMKHNPNQLPKTVKPQSARLDAPQVHPWPDGRDYASDVVWLAWLWVHSKLGHAQPEDLMVLCRYKLPLERLQQCLQGEVECSLDGSRGVSLLSVHSAKGRQAEHVLILDASEGRMGFPSQVEDPAVLNPVRLVPMVPVEEERRLFYVALTRAKQSLDIQTCANRPSCFIAEMKL